jgi:hypothetical protein
MKSPNAKSLPWQISVEETAKQQKAKRMNMSEKNVVVANFNLHTEVGTAVKEFKRSDLPMKRLSIIGKDYRIEEHVFGHCGTGGRMKYWDKLGAFWGCIRGWFFGVAFFTIPGIDPMQVLPSFRAKWLWGENTAV